MWNILEVTVNNVDENLTIKRLLDFNDEEIAELYNIWDKGDCSLVGLTEIYLYQCIKKHKQENGDYYAGNGLQIGDGCLR